MLKGQYFSGALTPEPPSRLHHQPTAELTSPLPPPAFTIILIYIHIYCTYDTDLIDTDDTDLISYVIVSIQILTNWSKSTIRNRNYDI